MTGTTNVVDLRGFIAKRLPGRQIFTKDEIARMDGAFDEIERTIDLELTLTVQEFPFLLTRDTPPEEYGEVITLLFAAHTAILNWVINSHDIPDAAKGKIFFSALRAAHGEASQIFGGDHDDQ